MPRLRSLIPNLCSEATRRIRDFDLGLIGTMLLQLFKVGNITLQLLILEPYHQISGLSTLDPPAGYTPLVFFHLGLFYPSMLRSFHVARSAGVRRTRLLRSHVARALARAPYVALAVSLISAGYKKEPRQNRYASARIPWMASSSFESRMYTWPWLLMRKAPRPIRRPRTRIPSSPCSIRPMRAPSLLLLPPRTFSMPPQPPKLRS